MKKALKYFIHRTYRPVLQRYLQQERTYRYEDIIVVVPKGIFHPGFYFSTKLLLRYLKGFEFQNKTVLELGCGSGLISIWCAKKGASVTASDINPEAVKITSQNAAANEISLETIESDLFKNIYYAHFHYIIINPPYYPKDAANEAEKAWYCGSDFQYFQKLFSQIKPYIRNGSTALMILSDDCALQTIFDMAEKEGLIMNEVYQKRYITEKNFIYKIEQL